jgi:hypothetical protein
VNSSVAVPVTGLDQHLAVAWTIEIDRHDLSSFPAAAAPRRGFHGQFSHAVCVQALGFGRGLSSDRQMSPVGADGIQVLAWLDPGFSILPIALAAIFDR